MPSEFARLTVLAAGKVSNVTLRGLVAFESEK
jgi:hypothetical protein